MDFEKSERTDAMRPDYSGHVAILSVDPTAFLKMIMITDCRKKGSEGGRHYAAV